MEREELREMLEHLYDKYNRPEFIEPDPISVPHAFEGREDREIAGFLAATIAWGNRKAIVRSARRMVEYMDNAPADFVSKQIIDVLSSKLIKRGIDLKAVSWDAPQAASGGTVRVLGHIVEGIDQATAKKINKDIKNQKLKVKVTIEADKLRVSSASKDALQTVIQFLRDQDYGQPLQFTNYR